MIQNQIKENNIIKLPVWYTERLIDASLLVVAYYNNELFQMMLGQPNEYTVEDVINEAKHWLPDIVKIFS